MTPHVEQLPPVAPFFFDADHLADVAARYRDAYRSADPFPHVVIDDFLPEDLIDAVLAEFPVPGQIEWQEFDASQERKLASSDDRRFGPVTRQLLAQFNAAVFLGFLEELTGIPALISDPRYIGGGLHRIEPGGFLKVHADFNKHQIYGLDRRLNLLLYLNRDWQEEWGGHLELWDPSMSRCAQRILPVVNRCVIFSTTDDALHGHPEPLTCPPDRARQSMALYYYSNGRPESEVHAGHTTVFRRRPGETFAPPRDRARELARRITPPVLWDAARTAKTRLRERRAH